MPQGCERQRMSEVPCRQLDVFRVMVCTQIEHGINELDPLDFQDLQICFTRQQNKHPRDDNHVSIIQLNKLLGTCIYPLSK